jgi:periodic tryptophan protein 1
MKKDIGTAAKELEKKMDEMEIGEEDDEDDDIPIFTAELAKMKAEAKGEKYEISDEDMDEEVNNRDKYPDAFSDSEEEKEDFTIKKTDSIIVAATADNDHSNLEVYVYEHDQANLYVHHEIILGAYPLCLEWLPVWQGEKANMIIVGTFLPQIEIWNLDSENCEPVATLGSVAEKTPKSKSKKKTAKLVQDETGLTHTDAVMSISLNPHQREYLASGSADHTVKIWDLDELACKADYSTLHSEKVQVVRWNRINEQVLLTGGYDGRLNVLDVRASDAALNFKLPSSARDIESAQWHPTIEHNFVVTTESGQVFGFDARNLKEPVFTFAAHSKACSSASFSPHVPNMLATVGTDKKCKIWDIAANVDGKLMPQCVAKRDME